MKNVRSKHLRKIPEEITRKIAAINTDNITVGSVVKLASSDIDKHKYSGIGIYFENGTLKYPEAIVPRPEAGKYSAINALGTVKKLTDKPMVWRDYPVETPNFGDWSKGSHTVYLSRQVYQTLQVPPQETELKIEFIGEEQQSSGDTGYTFRFTLDRPLSKTDANLDDELLRLLNLLQENVGAADVFSTDATLEDYLRTVRVHWEILPPGERDTNIARIAAGIRNPDPATRKRIIDRYDFFVKLGPTALIQGTGGFKRYFGAQFSERVVSFENMEYGNAIYIMVGDWRELSQKTKQELVSSRKEGEDFFRVTHNRGWQSLVRNIIRKLLRTRKR
jgi:hypothetical protein